MFLTQAYRCNSSEKMTRKNLGSSRSGAEDQVTKDTEKSLFLKAFYVWVLSGKICLQESWAPEKVWKKDELPLVEEDQIREHLNRLDITEVHPDMIHL